MTPPPEHPDLPESVPLTNEEEALFERLRTLVIEKPAKWKAILDRLEAEEGHRRAVRDAMMATMPVLQRIWDNPEDAAWDNYEIR